MPVISIRSITGTARTVCKQPARNTSTVDAKKLTVPQAAFLATVVNNPSMYDPSDKDNRERILSRYRYVMQLHG